MDVEFLESKYPEIGILTRYNFYFVVDKGFKKFHWMLDNTFMR